MKIANLEFHLPAAGRWNLLKANYLRMKNIFCLSVLLAGWFIALCQHDINWTYGMGKHISFKNNVFSTHLTTVSCPIAEGIACISTLEGDLALFIGQDTSICDPNRALVRTSIFSTDGLVHNGNALKADANPGFEFIFLPSPLVAKEYLLFYINNRFPVEDSGFYYARIVKDTSYLAGYRVVERDMKIIKKKLNGRIAAIRHANGQAWWIILQDVTYNKFFTILTDGRNLQLGSQFTGPAYPYSLCFRYGAMKFSPDGKILAVYPYGSGRLDLYNFDRCTGQISFRQAIGAVPPVPCQGQYFPNLGIEFSRSSRFLYAATRNEIYQFDLNRPNIVASRTLVLSNPPSNFRMGDMKLGPDGRIYVQNTFGSWPQSIHVSDSLSNHLTVIMYPDSPGLSCQVMPYSLSLNGLHGNWCFANFPNYYIGTAAIFQLDTPTLYHQIYQGDTVVIGIADTFPEVAYQWQSPQYPGWSSGEMLLSVAPPGTTTFYYIRTDTSGGYSCNERIDTIVVEVIPCATTTACPVPPICEGDTAWLCASGDGSYLWSPNYNLANAANGGTWAWPETTTVYTVTLTLGNGCTATDSVTVIVHQNSPPTFEDTTIRKGEPFGEFFPTADTTIRYHYLNQYGCDSTVYWEVRIDTLNSVNSYQLSVNSVEVFPNPVRGVLYIKHTNQNAAFRLYNKLGQVVLEQQNLPPGTAAVSLRGLAEGVYFWEYALPETGARGKVLLIH